LKGSSLITQRSQAFLLDSVTGLLRCVSCASPFNPEPNGSAVGIDQPAEKRRETRNGTPALSLISGNGDYAFFATISPLVPADINGETLGASGNGLTSVSSDVYEWRRPGLHGCARPQGCLSLISDGREGRHVYLLGAADEGRDVFFSSASQLGPNDNDSATDIYDAHVGGGEAPLPPTPVECVGDSCFHPPGAPDDATPSSVSYQGPGNLLLSPLVVVPSPKAKPRACGKRQVRKAGRCVKRAAHRAKRGPHTARRRHGGDAHRASHGHASHGVGGAK
jgi:hypothetical protein